MPNWHSTTAPLVLSLTAVSVLILHGSHNHRPPGHWQFQLAAALAEAGIDVRYPSLPEPDDADPVAWAEAIEREFVAMPRPRVVVCHSLAVEAWLARGADEPAERLLLVAPPGADILRTEAPRFAPAIPFRGLANAEIWCSDSDPYNLAGAASSHAEPYEIPVRVFPGAGHFTLQDGYGRWPEVEAWARQTHLLSRGIQTSAAP